MSFNEDKSNLPPVISISSTGPPIGANQSIKSTEGPLENEAIEGHFDNQIQNESKLHKHTIRIIADNSASSGWFEAFRILVAVQNRRLPNGNHH